MLREFNGILWPLWDIKQYHFDNLKSLLTTQLHNSIENFTSKIAMQVKQLKLYYNKWWIENVTFSMIVFESVNHILLLKYVYLPCVQRSNKYWIESYYFNDQIKSHFNSSI